MSILGLGTDIIEIDRIARMIDRHAETFLDRVFTVSEREYCSTKKNFSQHYAGRFAAKEAVLKALGTGMVRGLTWQDIEITLEESGRPLIRLCDGASEVAAARGIVEVQITISHCKEYATATAIAVGS